MTCHRHSPCHDADAKDSAFWPIVGGDDWCGEWQPGPTTKDYYEYEIVDLSTGDIVLQRITSPVIPPGNMQEVRLWFPEKPSCNLSLRITHVI